MRPSPRTRRLALRVCTAVAGALVGAACGGSVTAPLPALGRAPADVDAASAAATLAGQPLTIEAFLWRDFMPPTPRDGRPLIATVRVYGPRGVGLPADVQADSLWVVVDGQAWGARAAQEQPRPRDRDGSEYLEVVARNGPKWAPGSRADVAVRVRDAAGRVAYLRVRDREIARTQ